MVEPRLSAFDGLRHALGTKRKMDCTSTRPELTCQDSSQGLTLHNADYRLTFWRHAANRRYRSPALHAAGTMSAYEQTPSIASLPD